VQAELFLRLSQKRLSARASTLGLLSKFSINWGMEKASSNWWAMFLANSAGIYLLGLKSSPDGFPVQLF
jgi:hypothetical protein